jgi:hypothetical protein
MTQISLDSLTTCLVTPDGARIRLNFAGSGTTTFDLSTALVEQLIHALPPLLSTALRIQHGDNCARDPTGSIAWAMQ